MFLSGTIVQVLMGQEVSPFREIGPSYVEPSFDRHVSHFLFFKKRVSLLDLLNKHHLIKNIVTEVNEI